MQPAGPGRGIAQLFAARAGVMLAGYLVAVLLARGLGPAAYGTYGLVLSVLIWLEITATAGIAAAMTRLLAQHDGAAASLERTGRALLGAVTAALFAASWLAAPALARLFGVHEGALLFRLAVLDLPLAGLYVGYQGALLGRRRFGVWGVALGLQGAARLGGTVLLVLWRPSVAGALVVNAAATTVALAYLVAIAPPGLGRPSAPWVRRLGREAVPLGLYLVAVQGLASVDLWCLKALGTVPAPVVGLYVAAGNVARLLLAVPTVLAAVLFPSLARAVAARDEAGARAHLATALRGALAVLLPAAALLAVHAEAVMTALYAPAYAAGARYLALQLAAFVLFALLDVGFQALMATGALSRAATVVAALVPAALGLNLVLIPRAGALGAAAALAGALGLGAAAALALLRRRFGVALPLASVVRVGGATGLVAAVGARVETPLGWLPVELAALGAAYLILLRVVGEARGERR